jgi:hypothetical protein
MSVFDKKLSQACMAAKEKTKPIRMTVSVRLYEYLGYLARHTMLGAKENDVATYLLTQRLEAMLADKYHETQTPPSD